MKKLLLTFLLLPFLLIGCKKGGTSEHKDKYINVNVNEITLHEEESFQIEAEILKKGTIVFYSSNNEDVATVDDNGLVYGVAQGETTINVRGGRDTCSVFVTVLPYESKDSLQIVLSKDTFVLHKDDTYELPLEVKRGNTVVDASLSYLYENDSVVSITGTSALATGVGSTKVVVTASYNEETVSRSLFFTVY